MPDEDTYRVIPHISKTDAKQLSEDEWTEHYGRPHALLRETDRRFLLGLKEYENDRSKSERRGIIRERLLHGILDLALIDTMTDRQRGKLLDELHDDVASGEVENAASTFLSLLYEFADGNTNWLDERVKTGIQTGYMRVHADEDLHGYPQVNAETTVKEPWNIDEIEERFRSSGPNALSAEEKWILHTERDVPTAELEDRNPTMGTGDTSDVELDADAPDSPFSDEE
jgi:hypothetical protein